MDPTGLWDREFPHSQKYGYLSNVESKHSQAYFLAVTLHSLVRSNLSYLEPLGFFSFQTETQARRKPDLELDMLDTYT